jgi:hypothetical protein
MNLGIQWEMYVAGSCLLIPLVTLVDQARNRSVRSMTVVDTLEPMLPTHSTKSMTSGELGCQLANQLSSNSQYNEFRSVP